MAIVQRSLMRSMTRTMRNCRAASSRVCLFVLIAFVVAALSAEPARSCEEYTYGSVRLLNTQITDNGDGDGFADTNETIEISITVESHFSDELMSDCLARLSSVSPAVDCIIQSEILIGDLLPSGPPVTPPGKFKLKIGKADRDSLGLGPDDPLEAIVKFESDCSNTSPRSQGLAIPLDLNVWDLAQAPIAWDEGFEDGTLGKFNPQNIDAGIPGNGNDEGLANGDGWRCQRYNPDWINSEVYGNDAALDCFPGMSLDQADAVFWQLDGQSVAGSPDGGRAKSGLHSMYYGVFIEQPAADLFTTPVSTVESVATIDPISLGTGSPTLTFWHQVSLADHRISPTNFSPWNAFDRGVLQIQVTDPTDTAPGNWANLSPVVNHYVSEAAENTFVCAFDPIDDGNDEDDFFDPTDPGRIWGPSSTCAGVALGPSNNGVSRPSLTWSFQGDTSTAPFDPANVGNATTPPAASDAPSLGTGTWVETQVDLTEYRGRRVRLRFLVASLKLSEETWFEEFNLSDDPRDDGWWIDDLHIDETLDQPAEFSNDSFALGTCTGGGEPCIEQCRLTGTSCSTTSPCGPGEGDCVAPCPEGELCAGPPPDCGAHCSVAQANVFVEPFGLLNPGSVSTDAPGTMVCLNARESGVEPSWVDACIDGFLEYRFCKSGDPDGDGPSLPDDDCDDPYDSSLFNPSELTWNLWPVRNLYPEVTTTYAFEVRCQTVPGCRDGETLEIIVNCPSGNPNTLGLQAVRAIDKELLTWNGSLDVDWLRGSFASSSEIGDYVADSFAFGADAMSVPMTDEPTPGTGFYYLVKADGPVNPFITDYLCDTATWRSGGDPPEVRRDQAFGDP